MGKSRRPHCTNHVLQVPFGKRMHTLFYAKVFGDVMQILVVIADGNIRNALRSFGENEVLMHLRHRLSIVSIHCDFSAHNQTASLPQKVAERDAV